MIKTAFNNPSQSDYDELTLSIEHYYSLACQHFNKTFPLPSYNFRQRGKAAGMAYLQRNELRFNFYMYQQGKKDFLQNVVAHEIAHLLVYQLFGVSARPHGREWQVIMQNVFGCSPSRTHTYAVPPPKMAFTYECRCQQHVLSPQRHKRALNGTQYLCRICKTSLQFIAPINSFSQ